MQFRVVAVGRMRDAGLRSACDDYLARINRYVTCEHLEVRGGGKASTSDPRVDEAKRLLPHLRNGIGVGLTRTGRTYSSRQFAHQCGLWQENAQDVALFLGGATGLDPTLLNQCDVAVSLSPMTLPHELARLVLLEQIYRAFSILHGEPYHKGD